MAPIAHIDIPAIERRARQLRAEEIRRLEGLFAERLCILGRLAAASTFAGLLAIAGALRPLFSWNPQAASAKSAAQPARAKRLAGGLLAWNPEVHHHV